MKTPILPDKPLISVVFSFRNEEGNLPELLRRLLAVFDQIGHDYEIIFVNDRSTDASLEVLRAARKENPRIKIVTLSRQFGFGPALICGLEHSKGDAVIYLDADLQDPPELIPKMLSHWEDDADVVHTKRVDRHGESKIKMWVTRIAYKAINQASAITIPENVGDFKLLSRRAVDQILEIQEKDPFIRGMPLWIGFKQATVEYSRLERYSGVTHFSLLRSMAPVLEFIRGIVSFSVWPLYFSLFCGFAIAFFAFMYLFLIVVQRVFFGIHLPGWPALMVTMLFLGGVILIAVGVLGIYVGKIFEQIQGRPRYVVDDTIGIDDAPEKDNRNKSV